MTNLFPGTQCGIGPATDEGFFYDFVVERPFVPEDLDAIETEDEGARRRRISSTSGRCGRATRRRRSSQRRGEPLKVQLIDEKTEGQTEVSCYTIKDRETFVDFCVGPHVPSTGKLKAFKLLTTSNAYWKGDARNQPMQRVYGTAFLSEKDLKAHLTQIEEAKKRDHRKLGRELGLFTFHPWAPGAAFWLDKGTTLYNTLANYMRDVLFPAGYVEVKTPLVYNKALWERSGHWSHYRQNMFLIESEGETMSMKPMNCPGHFLLYRERGAQLPRSADPLPRADAAAPQRGVRRAVGPDPRPPVLAGRCALLRHAGADRRRGRAADRARPARLRRLRAAVHGEAVDHARRAPRRGRDLGVTPKRSSRRRSSARAWPTTSTRRTARSTGRRSTSTSPTRSAGSGSARRFSSITMQPENFDLKYIGADNTEHRPVVIHRAIFGSFERFIAILIEHYAGAFPLWLAPVQAIVLPIADRHLRLRRVGPRTS